MNQQVMGKTEMTEKQKVFFLSGISSVLDNQLRKGVREEDIQTLKNILTPWLFSLIATLPLVITDFIHLHNFTANTFVEHLFVHEVFNFDRWGTPMQINDDYFVLHGKILHREEFEKEWQAISTT